MAIIDRTSVPRSSSAGSVAAGDFGAVAGLDRGGAESREVVRQLGALSRFLAPAASPGSRAGAGLASLGAMRPATCSAADWCRGLPPSGSPDPGRGCTPESLPEIHWATFESDADLALYLHHSTFRSSQGGRRFDAYQAIPCGDGRRSGYGVPPGLRFRVPQAGCWAIQWIDPANGATLAREQRNLAARSWTAPAAYPTYRHDLVLLVSRIRTGRC
jgi:hypothetical protein